MNGFTEISPRVYYLAPPIPEFGGGVTFIAGTSNFLIDCGAFDYSVSKFIVPALKAIKYDLKDIDCVLFTHCHPENIGGVHKLKQLAPHIRVMSYGYQTDRLKNPSYYYMNTWSEFTDYSPPFRELRGIIADGAVNPESTVFSELKPVLAQGHDMDCVCWHHLKTGTLICGDAVQGDGTSETGTAFFTSLQLYRNTLSDLIEIGPKTMVFGKKYKIIPETENGKTDLKSADIIEGSDNCIRALEESYAITDLYGAFIEKYARQTRKKKENLIIEEVVRAYYEDKTTPQCLGYTMYTFSEYLKSRH